MFSVIIPLYNKEKSILSTISSVLNQTYTNFELIVVDDGSTDNSAQIVNEINDSRIKLIKKINGGVCSARNTGIREAKYDFIAFLDADDIWDKSYLEEQTKMITDFPDAAMWGINFAEVDSKENEVHLSTGLPIGFRGIVQNYFGYKHVSDLFSSSSVVIIKDIVNTTGMFDERIKYSEDLDMWYRIILNYKVAFDSQILVKYSQDSENRAMERRIELSSFLPFYIDKYDGYCNSNSIFAHYIHTFAAANILKYYFANRKERKIARSVIPKLRFKDIHPKYKWIFKTPYPIGYLIFILLKFKHHIK